MAYLSLSLFAVICIASLHPSKGQLGKETPTTDPVAIPFANTTEDVEKLKKYVESQVAVVLSDMKEIKDRITTLEKDNIQPAINTAAQLEEQVTRIWDNFNTKLDQSESDIQVKFDKAKEKRDQVRSSLGDEAV